MTMMTRKDKPEKKIFLVLGGLAVLVVLGFWAYGKFNELKKNGGNIAKPKISLPKIVSPTQLPAKSEAVGSFDLDTAQISAKGHFRDSFSPTSVEGFMMLYNYDPVRGGMVQIGYVNPDATKKNGTKLMGKKGVVPQNANPYLNVFYVD